MAEATKERLAGEPEAGANRSRGTKSGGLQSLIAKLWPGGRQSEPSDTEPTERTEPDADRAGPRTLSEPGAAAVVPVSVADVLARPAVSALSPVARSVSDRLATINWDRDPVVLRGPIEPWTPVRTRLEMVDWDRTGPARPRASLDLSRSKAEQAVSSQNIAVDDFFSSVDW